MVSAGQIRKGAYFDSVTLMAVAREVTELPGVVDAAVVMGTAENRAILGTSGLLLDDFADAGDTDLLVAVKAESGEVAEKAFAAVTELLAAAGRSSGGGSEIAPGSMDGALEVMPDAQLALISVAGKYAGAEAMKALHRGLHVMLFSDNVPLETEVELKTYARDHGLLLMGPDCGTAIINGVPLAFANVVPRGNIGIVAAAGTGLQEVSSIIANEGAGVSQAIGTGGRDVKSAVGGTTFIQGIEMLGSDAETAVLLLVSKPPDPDVLSRIDAAAVATGKPVVSVFLGAPEASTSTTLEEAALTAVALSRRREASDVARRLAGRDAETAAAARTIAAGLDPDRRFVRGLYSGGTFCTEAQLLFSETAIHSNAPVAGAAELEDPLHSVGHTIVDLGADEFTVGRPHPMIDYSLRNRRIAAEAGDPETAVILLDVVLGYGSNPDPAGELEEEIAAAAEQVPVVCSVTGTDGDPQDRRDVVSRLAAAGATVLPTNAAAARFAAAIVREIGGE
jgi:succinyl-CoA synthetase alpha subunit